MLLFPKLSVNHDAVRYGDVPDTVNVTRLNQQRVIPYPYNKYDNKQISYTTTFRWSISISM